MQAISWTALPSKPPSCAVLWSRSPTLPKSAYGADKMEMRPQPGQSVSCAIDGRASYVSVRYVFTKLKVPVCDEVAQERVHYACAESRGPTRAYFKTSICQVICNGTCKCTYTSAGATIRSIRLTVGWRMICWHSHSSMACPALTAVGSRVHTRLAPALHFSR